MEGKAYRIIKGNNKIVFSAPHASTHKRNDSIRTSETRTGDLAKYAAKRTNSYCIYMYRPEMNDANWDKNSKYKNELLKLIKEKNIKVLFDIHGMASYREQDICIGINGGNNINNRLDIARKMVKVFKKYGFENIGMDEPFGATNPNCISTFISQKSGAISFQIEINRKYRSAIYKEFKKFHDLEKAFIEITKIFA